MNSSPDIGHTTDVTAKLCEMMVKDMLDVVLPAERKSAPLAEDEEGTPNGEHPVQEVDVDVSAVNAEAVIENSTEEALTRPKAPLGTKVGDWELIHRGSIVPPATTFGDLEIKGTKLSKPVKAKKGLA